MARRLATLRLFGSAVSEDLIARSTLAHVRRPRLGRAHLPSAWIGTKPVACWFGSRPQPGAHALVTLLLRDGLRISEALGADVEHIGQVHGHQVLQVLRKWGSRRVVALNPGASAALTAYVDGRTDGPLLTTSRGGRFDRSELGG